VLIKKRLGLVHQSTESGRVPGLQHVAGARIDIFVDRPQVLLHLTLQFIFRKRIALIG
jgi:hypothetical protein